MDTILQNDKRCYACGKSVRLHSHHIFFGQKNRKISEKYGLKVWLCVECHEGPRGVHHNEVMDNALKRIAQRQFEKTHTRQEFVALFGKNYLEGGK